METFTLNGFSYIDGLDIHEYSSFSPTLRIDAQPNSESLLFRLLLGTIDIYEEENSRIIRQKISYTKIRDSFFDNESNNPINDWLGQEYGIWDLENYFKLNIRKNRAIFDELLAEFTLFFINRDRESHVEAFLNLYRALEYISYSFPMVFSSMTSSYINSYDAFKSFFVSKDDGQLKFFSKFINVLFEEQTLRSRISIDTYAEAVIDPNKKKIIQRLCSEFDYSDNGSIITISYKNLLDFMISLRNSYFHFQSDRINNISNIGFNSNLFFSALNDKFANWISMIYLEILSHGIFKLNLLPVAS